MSPAVLEMYHGVLRNVRLSDTVVIILSTSFITYQIFKRFEPNAPLPISLLLLLVPSLLVPFVHLHIPSLVLAAPLTFAAYYGLVLAYVAAYRLSPFHPLARYPGPAINKLSKLTMAWKLYRGKQHLYYKEMHDRYGDIVRVGPNELSINRAELVAPILGPGGLPKGAWWYNRTPAGTPSALITLRDPAVHKQRRRTWDRAFSSASVKNYDELVRRRTRELLAQLERRAGQVVDLSLWLSFFSYDFMGDMVFGAGFNMMDNGADVTGVWHALETMNIQTSILAHIPWSFTYQRLIPGIGGPRQRFGRVAKQYVARRIQRGSVTKDLYYHLTDEEGLEPAKPSMPVVFSEGGLAIIAGSDTTATTLTVLAYYLARDPARCARLRAEVDACFPDGEEPADFTRMVGMEYLNACINESLRLVPPVLDGSPRCAPDGPEGCIIGPYYIPPGNQVLTHFYTAHHDARNFSHPDAFLPDRWLPAHQPRALPPAPGGAWAHAPAAFTPFSAGPASCVGKNLALVELRAVTCALVQRFEFAFADAGAAGKWVEGITDTFVAMRPPLMVRVKVRK